MLFISPEAGCGKTRAMTVTRHLVPRANHTADMSPAGLYYSIDQALERKGGRPTFLHDELDAVFGNIPTGPRSNEEMRKLINAGHDREETLTRKIGKSEKEFQLYAPMALAGKMPLHLRAGNHPRPQHRHPDAAPVARREDRPVGPLRPSGRGRAVALAVALLGRVHLALRPRLRGSRVARWLPEGIEDRDADCWEPLLLTGELAGGQWVERARVAAVAGVAASGVKAVPSEGVQLLEDIKTVFDKAKASQLLTDTLLERLKELSPRWRYLDAQRLAKLLSGYGIKPLE